MTLERNAVIEKMFNAAFKEKINQLARKYDSAHILELWTRLARIGCIRSYFCRWRWNQNMTFKAALDCLDDYFNGLEALLQERQTADIASNRKGSRKAEEYAIPTPLPKTRKVAK